MEYNVKNYGLKPSFSIIISVGWLVFLIAWFAFYAGNFSYEKNIAIILLSILVLIVLVGGMWAFYAIKMIPKPGRQMFKLFGFRWRIYSSIIIPLLGLIFLIIWFWFLAEPFNVWQNIAMFLIIILIIGGCLGVIWTRWGMMHEKDFEKFGSEMEKIGKDIEKEFEKDD